jgi:hypothetical protein
MSANRALLTFSYSIASGCPPHYNDRAKAAEQANWLLSLPAPLPGDYRLAATFEYEELSREYGMLLAADSDRFTARLGTKRRIAAQRVGVGDSSTSCGY